MSTKRSFYLVRPVLRRSNGSLAEVMSPFLIYASSPRGAAFLVETMAESTRKGFLGCYDRRGQSWPDDERVPAAGDRMIVTPVRHDGRAHFRSIALRRTEDDWAIAGTVPHTGRRAS